MTLVFSRISESWAKHNDYPSNTATIVWGVTDDAGADVTTDAGITAASLGVAGTPAAQCAVGGQSMSVGVGPSTRPLYVKDVTWTQDTPKMVTASTTLDSTLFIPSDYSESTTVQSVTPDVSGYVNTDLSSTTYDVSWWRYQAASAWASGGTYPWTDASPSVAHQVLLLNVADSIKVDAGGTPLKRPILGQQLTVSLTFAAKPTGLRGYWRSLRGARNNAASSPFLGDLQGEWLFTGATQRASTDGTLYAAELSFYRDPFGWCRQRAQSGPNGVFRKDLELEEITNPAATPCPPTAEGGTDKMLVAACVDWVQLHPFLGDFRNLFTSQQLAQVEELVA
jgi:hypothetical protein